MAGAIAQTPPAEQFGTPPTGEIPILFNDNHVYTKPDRLKQARVLSAIVRGKTILVPLRSMFEQMGGTVTFAAATQTVEVSKPGVDIQVTVGKRSVLINGEARPLDVPAEVYKGTILVPVRVISEALGAYVLWVSDKHLVVVRYLPSIPSPSPAPTMAPTPPPTPVPTIAPTIPAPSPAPRKERAQAFIVADAVFDPKVYDEFSPGNKGDTDLAGRVGLTFPVDNVGFLAEATVAIFRYPHNAAAGFDPGAPCGIAGQPNAGDPSCVSVLGPASGSAYVPAFEARQTDVDGRFGIRFAKPGFYVVGAYEDRYTNYGYPRLTGVGGGIEKTSNLDKTVDVYGSVLYFPQISGDYIDIFDNPEKLQYSYLKYQAGITISPPHFPLFLDLGYLGNHAVEKRNAPASTSENAFYAGLGIHL